VNDIAAIIEDIKGIVAVLDPKGYAWAEEAKRERREHEKETDSMVDPVFVAQSREDFQGGHEGRAAARS
jgi:hypothetical protein